MQAKYTIIYSLFAAGLTRTNRCAFGFVHSRSLARFSSVQRHGVVAHPGPFLLSFAAPGTALGPLRPW